jgi:DNA-binding beta-propeller fold protein YncE
MATNRMLALAVLFAIPSVLSPASEYHLIRNVLLGGAGGWDYITVDPAAKRIYIPRSEDIQVIDAVSGKIIGDITGMKGLHGVAVAPEFNRGFVTGNDPEAEIYLLDLKELKVTGKLTPPGAKGSDSLAYDPSTKRTFINTAASNNAQVVDAATGQLVGTVSFPGRPEAAVPDGKGNMFVNIVDKDEVVEYDAKTFAIKNTWSSAPCTKGYGIAMDTAHRRLFLACQPSPTSGVFVVMNADTGKVVASMPVGIGSDGTAFDPGTGDAFATCRDSGDGKNGATYVFHEDSPDQYSKVAEVKTIYGARTIALDPKTHHIFSIATEQNEAVPATPQNPTARPRPVPSSFTLVEIGK